MTILVRKSSFLRRKKKGLTVFFLEITKKKLKITLPDESGGVLLGKVNMFGTSMKAERPGIIGSRYHNFILKLPELYIPLS